MLTINKTDRKSHRKNDPAHSQERDSGDSMIGANIRSGDIVFIRQQPEVCNGQIAAVLVGDEATLKRFYHSGNTITLLAENPDVAPLTLSGSELESVRVIGLAVAFMHEMEA